MTANPDRLGLELHRLNLECFIEPSEPRTIEVAELQKGLGDGSIEVFTQAAVASYLAQAEGYEPKNGDAFAKEQHLRKAIAGYDGLEQVYVDGGPDAPDLVPCFIRRKSDPSSLGLLEKGAIADSFGGAAGVRIKKSGKDVKAKATETLPTCQAALTAATAKMNALLPACGAQPTQEASPWRVQMTGQANAPKTFPWRETCWPDEETAGDTGGLVTAPSSPENGDYYARFGVSEERKPATKAQADARQAYNDATGAVIEASEDVATLLLIINHVQDGQQFEFDPRQLRLLGF